jgi:ribosomal-protein-serine acetyltransferase
MNLQIDDQIKLELVADHHADALYELAEDNREHISQWMAWIDQMQSVEFMHNFINGAKQRNADGSEYAYIILFNNNIVGRIGIYKIDTHNKIGEIGYWISEEYQGYGITTKACKALISFGFNELQLNRIEIKCGTENFKSQGIPERLNFSLEGVLKEAELVNGKYIDLNLYVLLKNKNQ